MAFRIDLRASNQAMTDPFDHSPGSSEARGLDPLTEEALAWIVRVRSGRATVGDAEALRAWRARSPEHEQAYRAAVRLWRDLQTLGRHLETDDTPLPPPASTRSRILSRRAVVGGAIAASVAAYAAYHPPLGLWPSIEELTADYRTGKGERREVTLDGDVKLTLNTQTSVSVRSREQLPEIELIAGEAAVTMARTSSSPLVIIAAGGRLSGYRATFDARCIGSAVSVTCVDGSVMVAQGANRVALRPGEQAAYSSSVALGAPIEADSAMTTAWQQGLLIFHDRPLAEVIAEVNRYRAGKIIVMNATLGQRRVNGTFHLDRLDDVVGEVRQLFDAQVRRLPGGIVLLS
jgi:transmembrane sensor